MCLINYITAAEEQMTQLNLSLTLPQFDAYSDPSSIASRWKDWLEQFEITTNNNTSSTPTHQGFARHWGRLWYRQSETQRAFLAKEEYSIYERYQFKQVRQHEGELIDQFASRLRILAETCEFESTDDSLADQILVNCCSARLKEKILCDEKADLEFILKQGRILELPKQQASHITSAAKNNSTNDNVNALRTTQRNVSPNKNAPKKKQTTKCRNYGNTWPHQPSRPCPALGKTCFAWWETKSFLKRLS